MPAISIGDGAGIAQDIGFLFSYAWRKGRSLLLIVTVQSAFSALLPLIDIVGLGMVIRALMAHEPYSRTMGLIAVYLSLNLGVSIVGKTFAYLQNKASREVSNVMQFDYARDSLDIDYHYVQDRSILDLKKKSMGVNPALALPVFGKFLSYIVQLAGVIYIFAALSPAFTAMLGVTCWLSVVLTFRVRRADYALRNDSLDDDRRSDYLYKVMTDYQFAKEVRLNGAAGYVEGRYHAAFATHLERLKAYYRETMRLGLLSVATTALQTAAMYLYFSHLVFSGRVTIANYTVLLGATTLLASILLGFFDSIAQLGNIRKDVTFYREYVHLVGTRSTIARSSLLAHRDLAFSTAAVRFEKVSFTYPGAEKPVLRDIDLEIKNGERIAIVGLNGSGKTTLIKLLTRIYDPSEGRITLDGTDIRQIPFPQYSAHTGVVLQDFLLFAYSIAENIAFDKGADELRLVESCERSGLGDRISSLPDGTATVIHRQLDDNGVELSGGEAQKLALARAIYKDAEFLILDEPTSALDPIAEYELFARLNDIAGDRTVVFISHRLSSTRFCDRIVMLEGGEIVECGSHDDLCARGGVYAELFSAQARYYRAKEKVV